MISKARLFLLLSGMVRLQTGDVRPERALLETKMQVRNVIRHGVMHNMQVVKYLVTSARSYCTHKSAPVSCLCFILTLVSCVHICTKCKSGNEISEFGRDVRQITVWHISGLDASADT